MGLAWVWKQAYDESPNGPNPAMLEDAEAACRQALELAPDRVEAINLRGVILKMLGRYDEAIEVYRQLATRDAGVAGAQEHHFAAWSNLGMVYALAHDFDKAEDALRKGAELASDTADAYAAAAWRNLAALELQLGRPEALKDAEQAVARNRNDVACRVLYARARLTLGNAADLAEALDAAKYADQAANQERPEAKRIRALAHMRSNEFVEAIAQAEQAIQLGDLKAVNYLIMALARARMGDAPGARKALAQAEATWPDDLLDEDAVRVTADAGELWFESAAELYDFKKQAEALLDPGSGQALPLHKNAEPGATTGVVTEPSRKGQD